MTPTKAEELSDWLFAFASGKAESIMLCRAAAELRRLSALCAELEAERDALRAERDDLKRALAFTARLVQDWQQSAIAIGAERDAFRANSDRYLWLRDTHGGVQEGDANWPSLVQVCWSRHGPRDEKFPDEKKDGEVIDAAIDAARAAMKGTQ